MASLIETRINWPDMAKEIKEKTGRSYRPEYLQAVYNGYHKSSTAMAFVNLVLKENNLQEHVKDEQ